MDSTIADINGPDDTLLSSQLASGSNSNTGGSEMGQMGNAAGVMSFKNLWLCLNMFSVLFMIDHDLVKSEQINIHMITYYLGNYNH